MADDRLLSETSLCNILAPCASSNESDGNKKSDNQRSEILASNLAVDMEHEPTNEVFDDHPTHNSTCNDGTVETAAGRVWGDCSINGLQTSGNNEKRHSTQEGPKGLFIFNGGRRNKNLRNDDSGSGGQSARKRKATYELRIVADDKSINLAKRNQYAIITGLQKCDSRIKSNQIKIVNRALIVACTDPHQYTCVQHVDILDGVVVSAETVVDNVVKKQAQGIIHGVDSNFNEEDIRCDTGALKVKRLVKRSNVVSAGTSVAANVSPRTSLQIPQFRRMSCFQHIVSVTWLLLVI